jgi:hypothetical protein
MGLLCDYLLQDNHRLLDSTAALKQQLAATVASQWKDYILPSRQPAGSGKSQSKSNSVKATAGLSSSGMLLIGKAEPTVKVRVSIPTSAYWLCFLGKK